MRLVWLTLALGLTGCALFQGPPPGMVRSVYCTWTTLGTFCETVDAPPYVSDGPSSQGSFTEPMRH